MRLFSHSYVPAVAGALFLVPMIGCAPTPPAEDAGPPPAPVDAGNPQDAGQEDVAPPPVDSGPQPPPAECGNSVVEPGEDCDDGNQTQTDACRNNCRFNICGDGFLYSNQEECDDSNTNNGDGCSAVCLNEPPPLPPTVNLSGQIMDRKYVEGTYQDQVTVRAVNAECGNQATCTSGPSALPNGDYVLQGLPPQSALVLQLRYNETYGPSNAPVPTGFTTRVKAATYGEAQETKNLYHVKYNWLAQVAYDCGVYDDITNVWDPTNYPTAALGNTDWIRYSYTFGQLKDVQGNGVPNIHKDRLEVELGGYVNDTTSRNPNYFCWLEAYDHDSDATTPDIYRGTTNDTSYAAGGAAFVVFKVVNNADAGTGVGTQYVRVKYQANGLNFAEQSIPVQAGNISTVTLSTDADVTPEPIVDLVDFNTQIYPTFANYGCTACHSPEGAYPSLDLSGQPDDVFNNLMAPSTLCGPGADPNNPRDPNPPAYRVCVDYPKRSKLAIMPLLEDPPNHPNASFADDNDPTLRLYEAWMEQGAPRYANPPEPILEDIPVSSVMNLANDIGCTGCHGAATIAYGGLAMDGCIPDLDTNADQINDYEAAGIDLNGETNPDYKEDCVYYHLRKEPVDNDPYGFGYRVNPEYPDNSMLLRFAYCGPDTDENGAGDACNDETAYPTHPQHPQLLFDREGQNYQFFRSYIEGLYEAPVEDAGPTPGDAGPDDAGPGDAGPGDAGAPDAGN